MGTCVGAGLALWFAPRAGSELRERLADSGRSARKRASEQLQQASARVGDTVDELARKGRAIRDDVADAVAQGAREVERYATAAKTDGAAEIRKRSPDDRPPTTPESL